MAVPHAPSLHMHACTQTGCACPTCGCSRAFLVHLLVDWKSVLFTFPWLQSLAWLSLANNPLGPGAVKSLSAVLVENAVLLRLDLSEVNVGGDGASALGESGLTPHAACQAKQVLQQQTSWSLWLWLLWPCFSGGRYFAMSCNAIKRLSIMAARVQGPCSGQTATCGNSYWQAPRSVFQCCAQADVIVHAIHALVHLFEHACRQAAVAQGHANNYALGGISVWDAPCSHTLKSMHGNRSIHASSL